MGHGRLILDFLARGESHRYGPHRSQRADLYVPLGEGPHPLAVVIHGGSWQKRYGKIVMRGIVGALLRRSMAVWNIEYRRLGEGGGWPTTFEDVAAAIDHLAVLEAPLDLQDVTVIGHSAGGHLSLWAAGRERLAPGEPGAEPAVRIARAVGQAPVSDLAGAYRLWRGGAARQLMGGSPDEVPDRYAVGDPIALVPLGIPVLLVHGVIDEIVSIQLSRHYAARSRELGGEVELIELDGPGGLHRAHIDPRGAAWGAVAGWLREPVRA
jgi:acetyl esterase/lipase